MIQFADASSVSDRVVKIVNGIVARRSYETAGNGRAWMHTLNHGVSRVKRESRRARSRLQRRWHPVPAQPRPAHECP